MSVYKIEFTVVIDDDLLLDNEYVGDYILDELESKDVDIQFSINNIIDECTINKNLEYFLNNNGQYENLISFTNKLKNENEYSSLLYGDKFSAIYKWLHDGRFDTSRLPKDIETDLTYYCESVLKL